MINLYEQFLYYWLLWIIFIIVAFFMETSRRRLFFMLWILTVIICSPYYIAFNKMDVSLAFFVTLIGAIIFFAFETITLYKFFVTFTVMISYVSLLIWEKITPIWFFMPSYLMIPFITVIIILLLSRRFYEQLTVALVGFAFGHFVYDLLLISYNLHDVIGDETFFIHVSIIVLFLTIMKFFHFIFYKFARIFERKLT